jgi:hypothetical protein
VGKLFLCCGCADTEGDAMKERIKELAVQAGLDAKEIRENGSLTLYAFEEFDLERFAELVRQDERELCAKVCLELTQAKVSGDSYEDGTVDCAKAIRARGNHEST